MKKDLKTLIDIAHAAWTRCTCGLIDLWSENRPPFYSCRSRVRPTVTSKLTRKLWYVKSKPTSKQNRIDPLE